MHNIDGVPLQPEIVFQRDRDGQLVFDDQDSLHGSTSVNVLPWPGTLVSCTEPPCASATDFTRARPTPIPRMPALRACVPRTNSWKSDACSSGGIPSP